MTKQATRDQRPAQSAPSLPRLRTERSGTIEARLAKSERAAKLQRRLAPARPEIKTIAKRRFLSAKTVGSFVPKLTQKSFEKYGFSAAALLTDWASIAGQQLAAHTAPERLKWPRKVAIYQDADESAAGRPGATLILRVDPAKALDVQYGTNQLIERINRYFGYQAVAQIRILQAPVDATARRYNERAQSNRGPADNVSGAPAITNQSSGNDRDELQASLERLKACFPGAPSEPDAN